MFKLDPAEKKQNINNPMLSYPQYIRDLLGSSRAEYFSCSIFAKIDEERFSCLFSANCKQEGRLELIYTVNQNLVKMLQKEGVSVPSICEHYLEEKDKANQIYRLKKEEAPQGAEQLLKETLALGKAVPLKLKQTQAYSNLTRLIGEQATTATEELVVKKAEEISAGIKPPHAEHNVKQELYPAQFAKEDCSKRSLLGSCIVKEQKKAFALIIIEKKLSADRYRSLLGAGWHRVLAAFRAGVEGVPSVLRRAYDIDGPPIRGLVRTATWDHLKVIAFKFRSFFRYCQRTGTEALSLSFIFHRFTRLFLFCRPALCHDC